MNFVKHLDGKFFCVAAIGFFVLLAPHCQDFFERDTEIEIDGRVPPKFTFSGNGQVSAIVVTDVSASDLSMYATERAMWEIVPVDETNPSRFPKITYGVVPPGFVQRWPASGSPRALEEEKPYRVSAPTSNANTRKLLFIIRNGQTLRLEMADDEGWYVQTPTPK